MPPGYQYMGRLLIDVERKENGMSTNLTDEMLPLIPRPTSSASRTPVESGPLNAAELLRQNAVSLVALVAITAVVVYLIFRT